MRSAAWTPSRTPCPSSEWIKLSFLSSWLVRACFTSTKRLLFPKGEFFWNLCYIAKLVCDVKWSPRSLEWCEKLQFMDFPTL
jgi:hypothetical protein